MKKKHAFILALMAITVIVLMLFLQSGSDQYSNEIQAYWEDRIDFLKNSEASPFQQNNLPYQPIAYFEPEKKFRVNATLDRFTQREVIPVVNSDGTSKNYLKFAYANFKIEGVAYRLLILKALGFGNNYFTGFGDETSGITTYGGGRYLDLDIGKSNEVLIDFNKAYNPYCAYVDGFACPLPPSINLLPIKIQAGEKYLY